MGGKGSEFQERRGKRGRETSSDSSAPSNGEGADTSADDDKNSNDGDGEGGEDKEDGETWFEWMIRTAQVAPRAMEKAKKSRLGTGAKTAQVATTTLALVAMMFA